MDTKDNAATYSDWTVNQIEEAREVVHAEIGRILISGLRPKVKSAKLASLKRQRRALETALEVAWKERMEREAAGRHECSIPWAHLSTRCKAKEAAK